MTLLELEATLKEKEAKLLRLKSGEMKCTQKEGDGRQEEAIHRTEGQIRGLKADIEAAKGTKGGK